MSLSKQLYLGVIFILVVIFLSTLWINVTSTSTYINKQLSSHAADAATSLGLSIKPFLKNGDEISTIDTRIQSIFDSGFYQQVTLKTKSGDIVLKKENPEKRDLVPDWFISAFPLQPPKKSISIGPSWIETHELEIVSNPGFAYEKLWHSAKQSTWMILALFIVIGVLVTLLLRTITVPIKNAAKQAEEICLGNFVQVNDIPKPIELNLFVNAMNRMSNTLQNMFNKLSHQTQTYQKFAFVDELSGLPNRRAFNNQLESLVANKELETNGYLIIIRLSNLDFINKSGGYLAGDEYVKSAATILTTLDTDVKHKSYRLNGADFAIITQESDIEECQQLVTNLMSVFNQTETPSENIENLNQFAHMGVAPFSVNHKISEVLTMADSALVQAKTAKSGWVMYNQNTLPQSNTVWKTELEKLLMNEEVELAAQAIKNNKGDVLYKEIYARFTHTELKTPIPMAQLILVAQRLNLLEKIDKLVISKALQKTVESPQFIALNINTSSIAQSDFSEWLIKKLMQAKSICRFVTFEISEQSLVNHADKVCSLTQSLKNLGCKITLEHFGESTSSFTHLMQIKPNYVKIDGSYCQQIENSTENQLFIQSLVNIAHSLQINVIAELIESSTQQAKLKDLFVDYYQGFHISKPQLLANTK